MPGLVITITIKKGNFKFQSQRDKQLRHYKAKMTQDRDAVPDLLKL